MPKKGQNDLKFKNNMHYGDFNHLQKDYKNLPKNYDFLAKKSVIF
jgi:endonuclease I